MTLPKFMGRGDKRPMPPNNNSMNPGPVVPLSPAATSKKRSEVAAAAAQQVYELETSLENTHAELVTAINSIQLLEAQNEALRNENESLKLERDYHKGRHRDIETSLRNSASILIDVMRGSTAAERTENDKRINAAMEGVEAEIQNFKPQDQAAEAAASTTPPRDPSLGISG